jgi:hypothetical protein
VSRRTFVVDRGRSQIVVLRDTAVSGIVGPEPADPQSPRPATIVRKVLSLPAGLDCRLPIVLQDISGRKVLALRPGPNDVSALAPGVYFLHSTLDNRQSKMTKVVIQR